MVFLLLSSLIFLHLIGQIYSRLCYLQSISLEGVQRLLLLLKFSLMSLMHNAHMLELYFQHMDAFQCLMQ